MSRRGERSRGSALLMALFVLVLLTGMACALLFLSRTEARMGQANVRLKRAFYLAEAGVEDGRVTLFVTNGDGSFDDDLAAAAGPNGLLEFDPDAIEAVYATDGSVTGWQGAGDDVPLRGLTPLGMPGEPGWYAAFLTNDAIDGADVVDDGNHRVMITGIGAGSGRSLEIAQAIVLPHRALPSVPAAAITLLGPSPDFDHGTGGGQSHTGDDCGVPGDPYAPIVGTVGGAARDGVRTALNDPSVFGSGPYVGEDTIGDLTDPTDPIVDTAGHGALDPFWTDCTALRELMLELAAIADHYCDSDAGPCSLPATSPGDIVFIDGDLAATPAGSYTGILAVTGKLTYGADTAWDGIILAVGEGFLVRDGGGAGDPSGAVVVAAIDPTPDGPNADKSDWCSSPPDGFEQARYHVTGTGNATVRWCTDAINDSNSVRSYRVTEFLQR